MNMTLFAAACLVGCVPLANIGAQMPSTRNSVVECTCRYPKMCTDHVDPLIPLCPDGS
jgi:hypothetical protein